VIGRHDRIAERVFMVGGSGLSDGADCLVYALDLGDLALIDCGAGSSWPQIRTNIRSAGQNPDELHTLVLTHAHVDHIGSAARIKTETNCRIVAHANDAPAIESGDPGFTVAGLYGVDLQGIKPDYLMKTEEETLQFRKGELKLIHTPGHTPGSIAVVYQSGEERIIFGQDIHGPFSPAFGSDLNAWKKSMQKLIDLKADILCEGHFGVFRPASEVKKFIQEQLAAHKSMMPKPIPL
jgi:glyoxylase-like metal-dependent hydrolase (beta-lactamase superfamily II)